MSMTKECEICGAIFQTDRISRKYCEECGKNPTRARQRIARAVRVNKRNAGDWEKVYDCICKYCGKPSNLHISEHSARMIAKGGTTLKTQSAATAGNRCWMSESA